MSCIVRPGTVMKYTDYEGNIYFYILNDVVTDDKVYSGCVSSVGDLLSKSGYFVVDTQLGDNYEIVRCNRIMDCCPKEGELYLYKSRYTEGEWEVLEYTKLTIGYCFVSLTTCAKYNLPGSTFVYPLSGLTKSIVTKTQQSESTTGACDRLAEEYHNLLEEYDKLGDDYEELYDSNNELVSDYQVLKEDKEDLEKKVEYYVDQCKHFKEEVDSLKKENEKLKAMNEVKTEAIENYIHPDSCKYWDGESCTVEAVDVKPYEKEIERLKDLVIRLTEAFMERR